MLSRKPALVGSVYMLVLTAALTKKLCIGDIVPLYALAAAVCSVQELSEDRFFNSSEMKEIEDSSLCRLREQLFFVVTVPAYKRQDCQHAVNFVLKITWSQLNTHAQQPKVVHIHDQVWTGSWLIHLAHLLVCCNYSSQCRKLCCSSLQGVPLQDAYKLMM